MLRVVVVDDDRLVSVSLKTILETSGKIQVVATGNDGSDGVALYHEFLPDVMLMDIRMQNKNGIEAAAEIIQSFPGAKILLLTTFTDDEYVIKALDTGVKGYILKQDFEGIIPAIEAVNIGQTVFGGEIVNKIPNLILKGEGFDYSSKGISEKEFEIIQSVAQGLSNKEIAEKAFLSEGTVRNYLSIILEKLELRDRTQLAVFYYQNGGN